MSIHFGYAKGARVRTFQSTQIVCGQAVFGLETCQNQITLLEVCIPHMNITFDL